MIRKISILGLFATLVFTFVAAGCANSPAKPDGVAVQSTPTQFHLINSKFPTFPQ